MKNRLEKLLERQQKMRERRHAMANLKPEPTIPVLSDYQSYKVGVIKVAGLDWVYNAMRFPTMEVATAYAQFLLTTPRGWVRWHIVKSRDKVNAYWPERRKVIRHA